LVEVELGISCHREIEEAVWVGKRRWGGGGIKVDVKNTRMEKKMKMKMKIIS
jgi:hypothetical protein